MPWSTVAVSRALSVSYYREVSVLFESSADSECGGWLVCGNGTIAQLLKHASRKSGANLSAFIPLASTDRR